MKRDLIIGVVAVLAIVVAGLVAWEWRGTEGSGPAPAPSAGAPPNVAGAPVPPSTTPSFDVVRVTPEGNTVIAGRAAPGAEVTVRDGGREVGRVTADANGEWVLTPTAPLPPGSHQLSLEARSPKDGSVSRSEGVVAMVVPPRSQPSGPVAVLLPPEGPARALQLPADRRKLALDIIEYDAAGKVQLLGRALAMAGIDAYLDERPAGHGSADKSGAWSLTLDRSVPVGHYRLRLEAKDAAGDTTRLALTFNRVSPPEGYAAVDIQPGNTLWHIAEHSFGEGLLYTEIYQANRGRIHDPNLIYPGQVFAVPASGQH